MAGGGASTFAFNFRAGGTLTPKLLLGFDGGFTATDGDGVGSGASVQANYYDLGIMYFPVERGPFLRAGVGLSSLIWEIEEVQRHWFDKDDLEGATATGVWLGFDRY